MIVADNIGDYAKAIGMIAEEGRKFEKYYDRNFGNNDVAFITERLKYTKEQLGTGWENDGFYTA